MLRFVAFAVALAAGCNNPNGNTCFPAPAQPPAACPTGAIADATNSDPGCFDQVTGAQLCRDTVGACAICSGAEFPDNCVPPGESYECVHACIMC